MDTYITYYHIRAKRCKICFYVCNIIKCSALAIIPVIQVCGGMEKYSWFGTVSASICLLVETILKLFRMEEKWILYRTTANALMSEKRKYMVSDGFKKNPREYFEEFVTNIEAIIDGEGHKWIATFQEKEGE